jgi:hypothetical protein
MPCYTEYLGSSCSFKRHPGCWSWHHWYPVIIRASPGGRACATLMSTKNPFIKDLFRMAANSLHMYSAWKVPFEVTHLTLQGFMFTERSDMTSNIVLLSDKTERHGTLHLAQWVDLDMTQVLPMVQSIHSIHWAFPYITNTSTTQ